jgi:predicted DNA-binding transcriptional regulator AlpA
MREVSELLGLTPEAVRLRRQQSDFPEPVELGCGPVWTREQIVEYARSRSARYFERAAIQQLAWGKQE